MIVFRIFRVEKVQPFLFYPATSYFLPAIRFASPQPSIARYVFESKQKGFGYPIQNVSYLYFV